MKIQGIEPITQATRVALRALVTTCFAAIALDKLAFENSTLEFFGLKLAKDSALIAINFAIAFQALSYLIFWAGDFVSLGHWNGSKSITESPFGGGAAELKTRVQRTLEHLKNIEGWIKNYVQETNGPNNAAPAIEHLSRIEESLEELKDRTQFQTYYFYLYFYVWHAMMPILLVCFSLFY